MCGIAGIVGKQDEGTLAKMLQIQRHRGPDYTGVWSSTEITLGHNRLSILDLSQAGNQPMHDISGRFTIVFNGEVYNYLELKETFLHHYPFRSHSDTEVILALFILKGADMLKHLIGMFSIAIWDREKKELFVARDRFGVKPFYYTVNKECLLFASEIKAIWKAGVPKEYCEATWSGFFCNGSYGLQQETFWKNIYALPAGHYFTFSRERSINIVRWYKFEESVINQTIFDDENLLADAYEKLLLESVKLRFRADVSVGFNLSGGLDSSVLLSTVNTLFPNNDKIKAYSFYTNDERYDELPWVKQLIAQTGKSLNPVLLDVSKFSEAAFEMAIVQDEPYGGVPNVAYGEIFKNARKDGTIVLLDGQGMDEAWAGYDYYHNKSGGIIQGTSQSPVVTEVLDPDFIKLNPKSTYPTPFDNKLQNLQFRDLFYTKIPRALRFNDRASMMNSCELREPFLDHRLVELAFAQKEQYKISDGQTKWLIRKRAIKWLGGSLALAPKRPIQTPQREWLREDLKDWASDYIQWLATEGNPGWFDRKALLKKWNAYLTGESDNSFYVWQWINTSMILKGN